MITQCLKCGEDFISEGLNFNRVCSSCKIERRRIMSSDYELTPIHNWAIKLIQIRRGVIKPKGEVKCH